MNMAIAPGMTTTVGLNTESMVTVTVEAVLQSESGTTVVAVPENGAPFTVLIPADAEGAPTDVLTYAMLTSRSALHQIARKRSGAHLMDVFGDLIFEDGDILQTAREIDGKEPLDLSVPARLSVIREAYRALGRRAYEVSEFYDEGLDVYGHLAEAITRLYD